MTEKEVLDALYSQLKDDSNLSSVKQFLIGAKKKITMFPSIMLEWFGSEESGEIYTKQEITSHFIVTGLLHSNVKSNQVGDMLTLKNNILKAISSDRTLGLGNKTWATVVRSTSDNYDFFPIRAAVIEVDVYFRQGSTSR